VNKSDAAHLAHTFEPSLSKAVLLSQYSPITFDIPLDVLKTSQGAGYRACAETGNKRMRKYDEIMGRSCFGMYPYWNKWMEDVDGRTEEWVDGKDGEVQVMVPFMRPLEGWPKGSFAGIREACGAARKQEVWNEVRLEEEQDRPGLRGE
jgi:hypothetical protein